MFKIFKKAILLVVLCGVLSTSFTSCATIFGGRVTDCQKIKPAPGQPARQVRVAALVLDCLCGGLWVVVDFATNAIYKPCGK